MKNGKGRIEPWQPKRKQRRKAAKSTKNCNKATTTWGRDERPQSFWSESFLLHLIALSAFVFPGIHASPSLSSRAQRGIRSFPRAARTLPALVLSGGFFLRKVDRLLRRRTQIAIRAKAAMVAGFGVKFPSGDIFGRLAHFDFRVFEIPVIPGRHHHAVVFEIMKNQTIGPQAPGIFRGQRIQRKLQTPIGVLLRFRLPGFVVDDSDAI